MMNDFSYDAYRNLIDTIKNAIPLVDFANIKETDERFFILRHDVEFSVEKAYELAKIEHDDLRIQSSYFFQIRNYSYNALAFKNVSMIQQIYKMGHKIGLHVNSSGLNCLSALIPLIKNDLHLLQDGVGVPIDRFSFHRPTCDLLKANLKLEGYINAYDKKYFHYYAHPPSEPLSVYYFSDSQHQWKYGNPLSILEKPIKKIQLLTHPYSWSKKGLNNTNNFKEIIKFKYDTMLQSMHEECQHFPKELLSS